MHVGGITVDLNWLLQFVFTAFVIAFGMLHLVKNTASKYFEVDASFESSGDRRDGGGDDNHDAMHVRFDASCCANCGASGTNQCSRCKSVKYCSVECQRAHWKSEHNSNCRVNLKRAGRNSSGVALVASGRRSKIIKKPREVLFPYEEFIRLYNSDKPGFPPCGLLNCGNSCFANVVLQCLTYTKPLVAYLLERGHRGECRRDDWCFLCVFQAHVERASQDSQPFSPINILSRLPNIGGNLGYGRQEDAHEFMRFAVDTMQSACLEEFGGEKAVDPTTQETTLIQHIFGGHLQSQVICTKCNKISDQFENMMDLTVEIHGDASSLEECLDQFTGKEWLHGDNMYKCDGCNGYVKAWKRLTIRRAPNILTIALKRFQSGRFGKLNKRITFPETLDLNPYMSEGGDGMDIYRLYAVVVHVDMLNASFFGHYICYTKDAFGNWYRVNDCKVERVEVDEVLSQSAYMLLYSRVSVRPYSLRVTEPLKEKQQPVALKLESCSEKVKGNQVLGLANTMSTSTSLMSFDNSSKATRETFEDVENAESSSAVPEGISCENEISFRVGFEDGSDAMDVDVSDSGLCTSAKEEVSNCMEDVSVAFNIGITSKDPQSRNVIVCNSTPSHVIGVSCHENDLPAAMDSTSVLIASHNRYLINSEPRSTIVKDVKVNGTVVKNMEANGTTVNDIKSNGAIIKNLEVNGTTVKDIKSNGTMEKDVQDNVTISRENGVKSSIHRFSSEADSIKTRNLKGGLGQC